MYVWFSFATLPGVMAESVERGPALCVGNSDFSSWSSETSELKNVYLSLLSQALGIIRIGQGLSGSV